MQFGFSTRCCPNWELTTLVAKARELGVEGVELDIERVRHAPEATRQVCEQAGVKIVCLNTPIARTGRAEDVALASALRHAIDCAKTLACPIVRVGDAVISSRASRASSAVELGDWLRSLADYAAEANVVIAIENAISFLTAPEMWLVVDRVDHPSLGICWDVCRAALAGEGPALSVPTLNSRIQHVHVRDVRQGERGVMSTLR